VADLSSRITVNPEMIRVLEATFESAQHVLRAGEPGVEIKG
jgi:hypothetical protein